MENNNNKGEIYVAEPSRRERILTGVMKFLAIVGTITLLALIAYVAVSAFQSLPKFASRVGTGLEAGVVSVTSVLTPGENEAGDVVDTSATSSELVILPTGENTSLETPTANPDCRMSVSPSLITKGQGGTVTLSWTSTNAVRGVIDQNIGTVAPSGSRNVNPTETTTYSAVFTGTNGAQTNCGASVVVQATGTTAPTATKPVTTATAPATQPRPVATVPAPAPTPVVTRVPADRGPADLAVEITGTGILKKVSGENVFVAKKEIDSDEIGAVRFVVTNLGSKASDTFTFKVTMPTRNDDEYVYTSKTQKSLAGGAKIEFTLGFDELPRSGTETIEVEIDTDTDAKSNNNEDSAQVTFIR